MKETREEYKELQTKEYIEKLNIDLERVYSVEEIEEMIETYNLRGGLLKFVPTTSHTGQKIVDTLVWRDLRIADAIHKNMGYYEDKSKCDHCEGYFDEETVCEVNDKDGKYLHICDDCRREMHIPLSSYTLGRRFTKEEREAFILEELKYDIDYTKYIERVNYIERMNRREPNIDLDVYEKVLAHFKAKEINTYEDNSITQESNEKE